MTAPLFSKIDHIGVAVTNIEDAIAIYQQDFSLDVLLRETLPSQQVEIAFLDLPDSCIELLAPTSPDSTLGRFLTRRGPGLHHICYQVDRLEDALSSLKTKGYRLIDETPRKGARGSRIAFIHPSSCNGVLTELCDYK